jgi:hypothetical protein
MVQENHHVKMLEIFARLWCDFAGKRYSNGILRQDIDFEQGRTVLKKHMKLY